MKLKKIICSVIALSMLISLAGCSKPELKSQDSTGSSNSANASNNDDVDIDLTKMSSTMVYSELTNMTSTPNNYIGKTVRATGPFSFFHDETTNEDYFAVIITDATSCCTQGIEFVLKGNHSYPEDYPEVNEEVTVTGIFSTYTEDVYTYCQLLSAELS